MTPTPTPIPIPIPSVQGSEIYTPRQAYFALVILCGLMLFDYIDRLVIAALLPYIKREWLLSDAQLGALTSSVNVAIAILALPVAILADRWSRTKSAGIMALIWSLATGACALAGNFMQLWLARFVIGVGEAGYAAAGNSLVAAAFPKKRATMIGLFQSMALFGSLIGVVVGAWIATHWGWRMAFGVVALPGFILAALMFWVKDYPNSVVSNTTQPFDDIKQTLKFIFTNPTIVLLLMGSGFQLMVVSTIGSWLPSFFDRVYGLPLDQAGARTGLFILISAIGVMLGAWLTDRFAGIDNAKRLWIPIITTFGSGLCFIIGFSQNKGGMQLMFIYTGAFMMVMLLGSIISVLQAMSASHMQATISGAFNFGNNLIGLGLGPVIGGYLSDQLSSLQSSLYAISFVCFLASGLLLGARYQYLKYQKKV